MLSSGEKLIWLMWVNVWNHWACSLVMSGPRQWTPSLLLAQWLTVSSVIQENSKAQGQAGEFPTSWVVTRNNSRHSLSKELRDLSAHIVSASSVLFPFLTYKSRGRVWKRDICLWVRAPFVFLTVVGLVPFIWFWFVHSIPHRELEAQTLQGTPHGFGLTGGIWASLHTGATVRGAGPFTWSWSWGEPHSDVENGSQELLNHLSYINNVLLYICTWNICCRELSSFLWGLWEKKGLFQALSMQGNSMEEAMKLWGSLVCLRSSQQSSAVGAQSMLTNGSFSRTLSWLMTVPVLFMLDLYLQFIGSLSRLLYFFISYSYWSSYMSGPRILWF